MSSVSMRKRLGGVVSGDDDACFVHAVFERWRNQRFRTINLGEIRVNLNEEFTPSQYAEEKVLQKYGNISLEDRRLPKRQHLKLGKGPRIASARVQSALTQPPKRFGCRIYGRAFEKRHAWGGGQVHQPLLHISTARLGVRPVRPPERLPQPCQPEVLWPDAHPCGSHIYVAG